MQWVREGAVPEQAQTDAAECRQHAWREATYWSWSAPSLQYRPGFRSHAGPYFSGPFGPHGSLMSPWRSPLDDPFFQESRLAAFCMENKGYRLVPAEKGPATR